MFDYFLQVVFFIILYCWWGFLWFQFWLLSDGDCLLLVDGKMVRKNLIENGFFYLIWGCNYGDFSFC